MITTGATTDVRFFPTILDHSAELVYSQFYIPLNKSRDRIQEEASQILQECLP